MNDDISNKYWREYESFLNYFEMKAKDSIFNKDLTDILKSPNQLIEAWNDTVESAANYGYTIFEWDYDITIREYIEDIINSIEIQKLESLYGNFKNQIMEIDLRLKNLAVEGFERPNGKYWWQRIILKGGVDEYKKNIIELYQIDLGNYK